MDQPLEELASVDGIQRTNECIKAHSDPLKFKRSIILPIVLFSRDDGRTNVDCYTATSEAGICDPDDICRVAVNRNYTVHVP